MQDCGSEIATRMRPEDHHVGLGTRFCHVRMMIPHIFGSLNSQLTTSQFTKKLQEPRTKSQTNSKTQTPKSCLEFSLLGTCLELGSCDLELLCELWLVSCELSSRPLSSAFMSSWPAAVLFD